MALMIDSSLGSASFSQTSAGWHRIAGNYWLHQDYNAARYRTQKVRAPGQGGSAIKRHGLEGRTMVFRVAVVKSSASVPVSRRTPPFNSVKNHAVRV